MYKVLVHGITPFKGGIESFIMNYYRKLNNQKIHFDFLLNAPNPYYEKELLENGSKIFYLGLRRENPIKYEKKIKKFFKMHAYEYDCFWDNESTLGNLSYLKMAKKYGIKKIIIHSHNSTHPSQNCVDKVLSVLHIINRYKVKKYATNYWACSTDAAKYFYPFKENVKIIKNAIDVSRFGFNKTERQKLRNKYGLDGYYVMGNVGRLDYQKNQEFLIRVLSDLIKNGKKAKLVLVGSGKDKEKLTQLADELKITKNVIFAGVQSNMQAWYSAFDLFIFPSRFEGLPLSLLEAQANGLPILTSIDIKEVKINYNNFFVEDLKDGDQKWSKKVQLIKEKSGRVFDNNKILQNFVKNDFELNNETNKLETLLIRN